MDTQIINYIGIYLYLVNVTIYLLIKQIEIETLIVLNISQCGTTTMIISYLDPLITYH